MIETVIKTLSVEHEDEIAQLRVDISRLTEKITKLPPHRSLSLAITKLEEANHWLRDRTTK